MTEHDTIAAAFAAAAAELSDISTTRSVSTGTYSYSYAPLDAVLAEVRPILARHGLAVLQPVATVAEDGKRIGVGVSTMLVHSSGEQWVFGPLIFDDKGTPQQVGSAITYARRYSLLSSLGIATDDDDGVAASRPAPSRPARPEPPPMSPEREAVAKLIAGQRGDIGQAVRRAFLTEFGCKLSELPEDRVAEAGEFVRGTVEALTDDPDRFVPGDGGNAKDYPSDEEPY